MESQVLFTVCLASVLEALAQVLQVNGIKAVPYHAGLDAKTRVLLSRYSS